MDAIELLRADHEKVLRILTELEAGPVDYPSQDQVRERKDLVTELVIAESGHEAVEEQYFWPMVREVLPDGDELADQAIQQENEAKQLLHDLDTAQADQPDFESMVARVVTDARAHIDYEQTQVWPKVLATVDKADLAELGAKMAKAKENAPTRPHPEAPSSPGMLKTAGRVAAAADKLRDVLTGRRR